MKDFAYLLTKVSNGKGTAAVVVKITKHNNATTHKKITQPFTLFSSSDFGFILTNEQKCDYNFAPIAPIYVMRKLKVNTIQTVENAIYL